MRRRGSLQSPPRSRASKAASGAASAGWRSRRRERAYRSIRSSAARRAVERLVQTGGGRRDPGDLGPEPGTDIDASPVGWNAIADSLAVGTSTAARLRSDVRLYFTLNASLHDAAIAPWGAKRTYQSPRPISMIRYLAFNNQLPLVPGLIKRVGSQQFVLRAGHWVPGERWSPLPPHPHHRAGSPATAHSPMPQGRYSRRSAATRSLGRPLAPRRRASTGAPSSPAT